jgi:hypothetical protein
MEDAKLDVMNLLQMNVSADVNASLKTRFLIS